LLLFRRKSLLHASHLIPHEGRIAIVTNVGMGRGCVGAQAIAGRVTVSDRQAHQTNDAGADGKSVWFWHPLLVSTRRSFDHPDRDGQNPNPPMTVARRIRRREERAISR
jgi:hypothetical protein